MRLTCANATRGVQVLPRSGRAIERDSVGVCFARTCGGMRQCCERAQDQPRNGRAREANAVGGGSARPRGAQAPRGAGKSRRAAAELSKRRLCPNATQGVQIQALSGPNMLAMAVGGSSGGPPTGAQMLRRACQSRRPAALTYLWARWVVALAAPLEVAKCYAGRANPGAQLQVQTPANAEKEEEGEEGGKKRKLGKRGREGGS